MDILDICLTAPKFIPVLVRLLSEEQYLVSESTQK